MPVRGRTGRVAGRALRAPGQLSGRQLACAGGAVCCGKEAGKDTGKLVAWTRFYLSIKRERQLAAPWREETAEALRRELLSPSTDGLRWESERVCKKARFYAA